MPAAPRVLAVSAWAALLGLCMAAAARLILWLIAGIANLLFLGRLSIHPAFQVTAWAPWHFLLPTLGGALVGLIARYGSRQVQGHGIPEAMEQVLLSGSKIKPRMLLLKPLSTCLVIGTGGPFGAEGVVIATGGALGSVLGQRLRVAPLERKALLAAGAAAGLSAAFNCPISAVLLAVELLLFEFHPRSLIPVALASACAAALRTVLIGPGPMFEIPPLPQAAAASLPGYLLLGAVAGLASVLVVKAVHRVEGFFERLPLHWAWKPAAGGLLVGLIGLADPRVYGPGYSEISSVLSGRYPVGEVLRLGALKLLAWVAGLASATSSGTLAPLLLIGTSLGALCSHALGGIIDPRVAALAGMAAFFGGMSGAFLASVVLAFEATWQPAVLMPLLAAATASYLVSRVLSRENIMTSKFVRQGIAIPAGLTANPLDWIHVAEAATQPGIIVDSRSSAAGLLQALGAPVGSIRELRLPAAGPDGVFAGWLRLAALSESAPERSIADLLEDTGAVVAEDATLREAARRMIDQDADRLAVLSSSEPGRLVGIITHREIVAAYRHEEEDLERESKLGFLRKNPS